MKDIEILLDETVEKNIYKAIISNPIYKSSVYHKIDIDEIYIDEERYTQFSMYYDDKVEHINLSDNEDILEKLMEILNEGYKQWDIHTYEDSFKILMNKKHNYKIMEIERIEIIKRGHDRVKNYILEDGKPLDFLISLGIMNDDGKVYNSRQKKFRQINRFLEIIEDIIIDIPENGHILDFGCGKSYLTFAIYYYANEVLNKNINIIGLDLKEDTVKLCNNLARKMDYENLDFICMDIKDYESDKKADMLITLHACNTATDYAIAYGINTGIERIISVPCCQHELFDKLDNEIINPIIKHGILKDRFTTLMTDGLRGLLLESKGYRVNIMEFIEMEHTPKNIMIKAVKTSGDRKERLDEYKGPS